MRARNSPTIVRSRYLAISGALFVLGGSAAHAQSGYYNLDAGRPTRVEDAAPTPRGELEVQFLPLRAEWVGGGTLRQRFEPKLAYGIFAMTEVEARLPIVHLQSPGSGSVIGIASAAIGALHAFNVETAWPALAISSEVVLPVGSMSASATTYAVKALMTKTLPIGRLELNVGGGSWSIRVPPPGPVFVPNQCGDPGQPVCIPPDVACSVAPGVATVGASLACAASAGSAIVNGQRSTGAHWTASLGVDHAFPLLSTLVAATLSVDRFDGLYPLDNWTAELGVRRQVTPRIVIDLGVGRGFVGSTQATSMNFGMTYATPLRWPW
jgi:hypothetical protein